MFSGVAPAAIHARYLITGKDIVSLDEIVSNVSRYVCFVAKGETSDSRPKLEPPGLRA